MFTLGIEKYEKGVVGNSAIVMVVVNKFSMKGPLSKIFGRHHCRDVYCHFSTKEIHSLILIFRTIVIFSRLFLRTRQLASGYFSC